MIDVAAIERATLAAVAPAELEEIDGWLLGLDAGTIRRAASAVPLSHDAVLDAATLDQIEAAYAARGLRAAFRLADAPGLEPARRLLSARGYRFEQPTLVKTGAAAALAGLAAPGEQLSRPDAAWAEVFVGEGFDPIDGAHRVRALSRSADAVYGAVREGDRTLAVGVAAFHGDWASVHGMRTAKAERGRGLAGRVLAALGGAMLERGVSQVFLQVEEANAPARGLYRRCGFAPAWRYFYWSKPD